MKVNVIKSNQVYSLVLVLLSTTISLLVLELFTRKLDGYYIDRLNLVNIKDIKISSLDIPEKTKQYALKLNVNADVDMQWFIVNPAKFYDGLQRSKKLWQQWENSRKDQSAIDSLKVWNKNFVLDSYENGSDVFFDTFPGYAFVYDVPNGNPHPRYRYQPDSLLPYGLATNHFGWRGPNLPNMKKNNVIRVGFIGASTTVGNTDIFSYPEFVCSWLNLWANKQRNNIEFECFNAGREGINSSDIASVVEQEIVQVNPDIVVYYEGSNQFAVQSSVKVKKFQKLRCIGNYFIDSLSNIAKNSALLKRILILLDINNLSTTEQNYELKNPGLLDRKVEEINLKELPVQLPTILADLDSMRNSLNKVNCEFILTSFRWLVSPEVKFDKRRHYAILKYLENQFPDIDRDVLYKLYKFQNRVFEYYAKKNKLSYLMFDENFPQDADLFIDGIHFSIDGQRLQGWVMFQELLPIVKLKIANGILPKNIEIANNYDDFSNKIEILNLKTVNQEIKECFTGKTLHQLDINKLNLVNTMAAIKKYDKFIEITSDQKQYHYISKIDLPKSIRGIIVGLTVIKGSFQVGILDADKNTWVKTIVTASPNENNKVYLTIPSLDCRKTLIISNGSTNNVSIGKIASIEFIE